MAFYAGRVILEPAMENPTIVVLTDRNDLDDQLFGTFARCRDLIRQEPVQAQDRANLRLLLQVAAGGVVFTTIQKFFPEEAGDRHPVLSDRRNIVVIADEAHRSQYDFIDGFARHMRDALPHASFIGFTGTPIEQTDANTRAVFGDYISVYDIQRSVADGATVPVYHEGRLAKLELRESERPRIDPDFEEATEGEEVDRKERLKTRWAQLEAVVGSARSCRGPSRPARSWTSSPRPGCGSRTSRSSLTSSSPRSAACPSATSRSSCSRSCSTGRSGRGRAATSLRRGPSPRCWSAPCASIRIERSRRRRSSRSSSHSRKGIERADSFIVDPHKWLFAPYDACALLYRDPAIARAAHTQHAGYLDAVAHVQGEWNPSDYAIHLTRRARGLPFWFSLATHGTQAYSDAIEATIALAREIADDIRRRAYVELVVEPELSVVAFRLLGWGREDFERWSDRLLRSGTAFVTPTRHRGETVMRFAIVSPRTTLADLTAILATMA
jgi:hypothetical protein